MIQIIYEKSDVNSNIRLVDLHALLLLHLFKMRKKKKKPNLGCLFIVM